MQSDFEADVGGVQQYDRMTRRSSRFDKSMGEQ